MEKAELDKLSNQALTAVLNKSIQSADAVKEQLSRPGLSAKAVAALLRKLCEHRTLYRDCIALYKERKLVTFH